MAWIRGNPCYGMGNWKGALVGIETTGEFPKNACSENSGDKGGTAGNDGLETAEAMDRMEWAEIGHRVAGMSESVYICHILITITTKSNVQQLRWQHKKCASSGYIKCIMHSQVIYSLFNFHFNRIYVIRWIARSTHSTICQKIKRTLRAVRAQYLKIVMAFDKRNGAQWGHAKKSMPTIKY